MPDNYNRISITITDQAAASIAAKIAELDALLSFCVAISDDDRRAMQKLGPATTAYAGKASGYMNTHPEYISPLFPLAEYEKAYRQAHHGGLIGASSLQAAPLQ